MSYHEIIFVDYEQKENMRPLWSELLLYVGTPVPFAKGKLDALCAVDRPAWTESRLQPRPTRKVKS
jgi:hypothetical protein